MSSSLEGITVAGSLEARQLDLVVGSRETTCAGGLCGGVVSVEGLNHA